MAMSARYGCEEEMKETNRLLRMLACMMEEVTRWLKKNGKEEYRKERKVKEAGRRAVEERKEREEMRKEEEKRKKKEEE